MANIAIVSPNGILVPGRNWNGFTGLPAFPHVQWPATGGTDGTRLNMRVYVALVPPVGSVAAGGATSGQLLPVGTR